MDFISWVGILAFLSASVSGQFTDSSGDKVEVIAGDDVILKCTYTSPSSVRRQPTITWSLNVPGQEAIYLTEKYEPFVDGVSIQPNQSAGTYNLVLKNVQPSNDGEYVCSALTAGSPRQSTQLVVNIAPFNMTVVPSGVIKKQPGDYLQLTCKASGKPQPTMTWTRYDELLPSGMASLNSEILTVQGLQKSDGGDYVCSAANGIGQQIQKIVTVEVLYKPEVSVPVRTIFAGPDMSNVELVCVFDAFPPVEILWTANGVNLSTYSHMVQERNNEKNTETFKLVIELVKDSDIGKNYTCYGSNEAGEAEAVIRLKGVPLAVEITSPEDGMFGDKYNIKWKVTSYSLVLDYQLVVIVLDGPNVTSQDEYKMTIPGADKENSDHVYTQEFMITGLMPETTYEAVLRARNKYGVGKDSNAIVFTTNQAGATPPPTTTPTTEKPTTMKVEPKTDGLPVGNSTRVMMTSTLDDELVEVVTMETEKMKPDVTEDYKGVGDKKPAKPQEVQEDTSTAPAGASAIMTSVAMVTFCVLSAFL